MLQLLKYKGYFNAELKDYILPWHYRE